MRCGGAIAGLALLVAATTANAQQAPTASLNQITRVGVSGGVVEIACAGRPNFTSLSLSAPPRLVLDFADTVLAEKPHDIAVQVPGLKSLRTEAFHSETGAVARVVLTLAPDADTDIAAAPDNTLRVKVVAAGSPQVARADSQLDFAKADADARARSDAQARAASEAQAKAASDAQARAEAQAKETSAAQARADAEARAAAESKARADSEARARADAEAKAQSESKARADAEAKAKAAEDKLQKLEAERAAAEARAASESRARADAEAQARAERERRESEAKAHADAEARHQREEAAAAEQARLAQEAITQQRAADAQRDAQARAAAEQAEHDRQAAAAKARSDAEQAERDRRAQSQSRAQAQADAEARAEQQHLAEQREAERNARLAEARAAAQAQPLPPRPETRVASALPTDHVAVRAGLKDISLVGFKQGSQAGRVFIRANDAVAYTVTETSPTLLLVEVQDARIAQRNGALPLDTSFFPGPVALITPSEDKRNRVVRVEIKLKARASYSARLEGSDVVIEFPNDP